MWTDQSCCNEIPWDQFGILQTIVKIPDQPVSVEVPHTGKEEEIKMKKIRKIIVNVLCFRIVQKISPEIIQTEQQ